MVADTVQGTYLENDTRRAKSSLNVLEKVYILLIVITSGTDLYLDSSIPLYCLIFVFLLLVAIRRIDLRVCGNQLFFCLIVLVVWTIQCLDYYNDIAHLEYVIKYTALLASTLLFAVGTKEKVKECFELFIRCILIFTILSSVLFFMVVIGINLPTIITSTHQGRTIFYLDHYSMNPVYGLWGYRNSGIYWEPGMYQIYLNLLLIYYLYKRNMKSVKRYLIASYIAILILTTGSVSGYVLCALVIAIYALNNTNSLLAKIVIPIIVILGLILFFPYLDSMINNKMNMGRSYRYRMNDILLGLEVFKNKPILGYGVINDKYAQVFQEGFGITRGASNGIINILINFGIIGLLFYMLQLGRFLKRFVNCYSKQMTIALICWLLISMSTEPIATHTFVFYLVGIGMCQADKIKFVIGKRS